MEVETLLSKNDVYYKSAGKDVLVKCLNPEHNDSNPSMRIDRITGLFNCFSCGFSGNIFTYYNEAINLLTIKAMQVKTKISNILKNDVLIPLGIEPFKREHRGISADTYETFGAFLHDNFEGRIVFPIRDITGKLVALMGRYAFSDASPKYFLEPSGADLPIYPARVEPYKDTVILVEGIFDVLNLHDKGLTNVICGFGKSLGESKKRAKRAHNINKFIPLKIQGIKKIFILYDDGAISSANKLARLLEELFIVEVVEYTPFSGEKDAGNLTLEEVDQLKNYIYPISE